MTWWNVKAKQDKDVRPIDHPSCREVMAAKHATDYLTMRKRKMGGTKRMDEKFDFMIEGLWNLVHENRALKKENQLLKSYIKDCQFHRLKDEDLV